MPVRDPWRDEVSMRAVSGVPYSVSRFGAICDDAGWESHWDGEYRRPLHVGARALAKGKSRVLPLTVVPEGQLPPDLPDIVVFHPWQPK